MTKIVTIVPYGSLRSVLPTASANSLSHPLEAARSLADVLNAIGVPAAQIQLAMVNHRAVTIETDIHEGDRIALFPKEYPIFVDWHPYRNSRDQ
ncbi:MAG: hypothetical protein JJV98_19905 [Desulfosarcina sp.]|nr:hypothetical protein [Desulfobacterales bacterium]